jgi:hypothetical protein
VVEEHETRGAGILGALGVFVSLAGVTASLTVVFLAMRSVMRIGGAPGGSTPAPSIWSTPGASQPASPMSWPSSAAATPAPMWPAGSAQGPSGLIEELELLGSLHSQGALSDREYKKAKERLLRSRGDA